jgi:hypothetical protein
MPVLLNFELLLSQTTVFFYSNRVTILLEAPVTSLLAFGNSAFACMLAAVMQRPRLRQYTFYRLEWRTRLQADFAFALMALLLLTFVRSSSTWIHCSTTRLPLMQILSSLV